MAQEPERERPQPSPPSRPEPDRTPPPRPEPPQPSPDRRKDTPLPEHVEPDKPWPR